MPLTTRGNPVPFKKQREKQKSTTRFRVVLFFLVEITGPILITVTLLQSMHGALPGELDLRSVGLQ